MATSKYVTPDNLAPELRRTIALDVHAVLNFAAYVIIPGPVPNVGDHRRWVLGIDELSTIESSVLAEVTSVQDWVFGFLSYEMKNSLEDLHSRSKDELGYPTSYWFVPRFVFEVKDNECKLHVHDEDEFAGRALAKLLFQREAQVPSGSIKKWISRTSRTDYVRAVNTLLEHIRRGDIYEVNFCTTRHAEFPAIGTFHAFTHFSQY